MIAMKEKMMREKRLCADSWHSWHTCHFHGPHLWHAQKVVCRFMAFMAYMSFSWTAFMACKKGCVQIHGILTSHFHGPHSWHACHFHERHSILNNGNCVKTVIESGWPGWKQCQRQSHPMHHPLFAEHINRGGM